MSERLLRCQLVIGVEGLPVGVLIIDSTEALRRTLRRCSSLLVSTQSPPRYRYSETGVWDERNYLFTSGVADAQER